MWDPGNTYPLHCQLGEGPLWHPEEYLLYGVDILEGSLFRFSPENTHVERFQLGYPVGCLGLRKSGGFVLAGKRGFQTWNIADERPRSIIHPEENRPEARFNDGRVDILGRFWAGTMTEQGLENSLYRLDPDGQVHQMEFGVGISNGIGWSPDCTTMFYTDSARREIYAYDYDREQGSISNRRLFASTREDQGVPDGLVVDKDGCIWSARWDGWKVVRYDPDGGVMMEIKLPVQRPTSCTFGGVKMNILFITSAATGLTRSERERQPLAGDLFWVETDTRGMPENLFRG